MKKTKNILSLFVVIVLLISNLFSSYTVYATNNGICGNNITYSFDEDTGKLMLNGYGEMFDYEWDFEDDAPNSPFYELRDQINEIQFDEGITSVGSLAFIYCSNLKIISLPNSLKTIKNASFEWCTSLENIYLPSQVIIDNSSFYGTELKYIDVSSSNPYYTSIDGNLYSKDKKTLIKYAIKKNENHFSVPDGVEYIDDNCFYRSTLESIDFPISLKQIGNDAFYRCFDIKTVKYLGNKCDWKKINIGHWNETLKDAQIICLDGNFEYCSEHTFMSDVIVVNPTCIDAGYTIYMCEICGEIEHDDYIYASGHSCNTTITTAPTCTTNGVKTYTCERCGETYIDTLFATGHSYSTSWSKDSTNHWHVCSACGTKKDVVAHTFTTTTTKATTTADGKKVTKCSTCGYVKSTTTIKKVSTVKLSTTKYTYYGKVMNPSLTVKDDSGKDLINGTDYTVSTPSGRKHIGKYTYKIAFKGNYSGTKTLSFTIVPKTTSISSLTAASKGFTVKWNKQSTQTTGYQIQIATDSGFTKGVKNYTVSKNSTVSKKITKLTGKKKYYVRIRTYKTVNGTKYYSAWSGSKTVTTKK